VASRSTGAGIEAGEGATLVVCNEANGSLIEVDDTKGMLDGLDFPSHRATEGEIAAGTCGITYPTTTSVPTPGGEGKSNQDFAHVFGGPWDSSRDCLHAPEGGGPVQQT